MKIGVIGAGQWGKNLVRNFHSLGALAGVADASEANRQWVVNEFPGIAVYEDHRELLNAGFDAVAIATPASTHAAIGLDSIAAGCDVFVEKPITLDPADAEQLCAAAAAAG